MIKHHRNPNKTGYTRTERIEGEPVRFKHAYIDFKADGSVIIAGAHTYNPTYALDVIECSEDEYKDALTKALYINGSV